MSKKIELNANNVELVYHEEPVFVGGIDDSGTFAYNDLSRLVTEIGSGEKSFTVIDEIIVDTNFRDKGLGTSCLKSFCDSRDSEIILTISASLVKEYKTEPTDDENEAILVRLEKFFNARGFVDVNEYIGGYEFHQSFIYKNSASKALLEHLANRAEKDRKLRARQTDVNEIGG